MQESLISLHTQLHIILIFIEFSGIIPVGTTIPITSPALGGSLELDKVVDLGVCKGTWTGYFSDDIDIPFLTFEIVFVFLSSRALKWHKPGVSSFIC